jgi:3-oxoadipate enol-lactonase
VDYTAVSAEQFADLEGCGDWRFLLGAIHADFRAGSFPAAASLVERIACTTPGGDLAYPFPEQTQRLLAELPQMDARAGLERAVRNALSPDAPQDLVDRIMGHRIASPPDPTGWQAQAGAAGAHDAGDRLDRIDAPTLVVHGTADVVVDPRNAALLGEHIPDAEVVLLDGLGHLLFWEDPVGFLRPVADFLARQADNS